MGGGLEGFSSQLGLFYALACNRSPPALPEDATLLIKWLDTALGREATFYACRAMRRLLLGVIRINDCQELPPGLIILSPGTVPGPLGRASSLRCYSGSTRTPSNMFASWRRHWPCPV